MLNNFIAIQHISFIISDLDQAKIFYADTLGLELDLSRPDLTFDGLWFTINNEQQIHLLKVDNPDPLQRPEHGGRDRHVAFKVRDLSVICSQLDKAGVKYTLSKSGRDALFCRDPDGNTLEIMT